MFRVYVLKSENTGRRYAGSCRDLVDRLHRHNTGQSKATKYGMPWILIHSESFQARADAVQKEIFYKTGRRDELNMIEESGRRGEQGAGSNSVAPIPCCSSVKQGKKRSGDCSPWIFIDGELSQRCKIIAYQRRKSAYVLNGAVTAATSGSFESRRPDLVDVLRPCVKEPKDRRRTSVPARSVAPV